jgi:hypothetical protein
MTFHLILLNSIHPPPPNSSFTMGKKLFVLLSSAILWGAVLWQGVMRDVVFITLGVGRTTQKIEDFPYNCKRIRSPLLESCEDMWLDEDGRNLYAACSTIANRGGWGPGYPYIFLRLYLCPVLDLF